MSCSPGVNKNYLGRSGNEEGGQLRKVSTFQLQAMRRIEATLQIRFDFDRGYAERVTKKAVPTRFEHVSKAPQAPRISKLPHGT
jgi:hypothetical protein